MGNILQRALTILISAFALTSLLSGCLFGESGTPRTRPVSGAQQVERGSKQNFFPRKKITDRLAQSQDPGPTPPPSDRLPQDNRTRLAARTPAPTERQPALPARDRSGLALGQFYKALQGLESGRRSSPVTILHLGDSHIAADRFSGDLRQLLQRRFGNAGRGLVMPGNPFGYSHSRGLKIKNQGNWKISNSQRGHPGPYGITGVRLTSSDPQSSLILQTSGRAFDHAEATLLTGPGMGSARIETDRERRTINLSAARTGLKRVRFKRRSSSLRIRPAGEAPVSLLSWSVGNNRPGIRYINLGIPGASMLTTRRWSRKLYADEVRRLRPDLIILAYGTNEGFNDRLNLDAYQRYYRQFAARLRDAAPRAAFLIIGPPDGARLPRFADRQSAGCKSLSRQERRSYTAGLSAKTQRLARWHAPPNLAAVRSTLKRIAKRIKARFWDWSKVMGSNCGIHKWANSNPKKAVSDHVHLTSLGARTSAKILYNDLMNRYISHKRLVRRSQ